MQVTLMTDASVCGKTGAGGYGMWVVSERGKMPYGGSFQDLVADSYIAEIQAVINSLAVAVNHRMVLKGDFVLIQLDNLGAISCLQGKPSKRKDAQEAYQIWLQLTKAYHLNYKFKHVKAHTDNPDQRSKANFFCDLHAKKGMQKKRKELQNSKSLK